MPGKYLSEETQRQIKNRRRFRKTAVSVIRAWIIFLVAAAIILLNLFTHVFQIVRYSGNGMEPNLSSGQILLLKKTQDVKEGDIIAFFYNNQVLVRRVICRSGKQISKEKEDKCTYTKKDAVALKGTKEKKPKATTEDPKKTTEQAGGTTEKKKGQ